MSKADFSGIDGFDLVVREALGLQRAGIDRRLVEVAMADGIGLDLGDLAFRVAERTQGFGNGAVDDLEVAAGSASFLNFTSAKSGSMPVVSQSMTRPIVPVGAITVVWALR